MMKLLVGATIAVCLLGGATVAGADDSSVPHAMGYDVSFPQCDVPLPQPKSFAIVGVNGGLSYAANPCLGALYQWASWSWGNSAWGNGTPVPRVSLYINTGNPGPVASPRWPTGQQTPLPCDGTWNQACSFDYGWNAAGDAFNTAAAVISAEAAASLPWWLDVETANSWNHDDVGTNGAAIRGYFDHLALLAPGQEIGIYSAPRAWGIITGATSVASPFNALFANIPNWVAGAPPTNPASYCSHTFSGGPVRYTQYARDGIDHNYPC